MKTRHINICIMKAVLRGKLIAPCIYIKIFGRYFSTNLMVHWKVLEKQEPSTAQTSRQEEIKIRAEREGKGSPPGLGLKSVKEIQRIYETTGSLKGWHALALIKQKREDPSL